MLDKIVGKIFSKITKSNMAKRMTTDLAAHLLDGTVTDGEEAIFVMYTDPETNKPMILAIKRSENNLSTILNGLYDKNSLLWRGDIGEVFDLQRKLVVEVEQMVLEQGQQPLFMGLVESTEKKDPFDFT